MKLIHTADIHLGSKMDSRFNRDISDERKSELRNTLKRLVMYAKENQVAIIMLCGDIFDSDSPYKKDKDFFYSLIRSTPEIDFLYLKGNHDTHDNVLEEIPENLKLFSDKWTSYTYGNVIISGIELCASNASSYSASLSLTKDSLNIVMLHGQLSDSTGSGNIQLKKLKNKNIDYLALGHIHKPSEGRIDERGEYVYCGCLEGRGFDEPGEHGFVLIDTDGGKIAHKFIPFAQRRIHETDVDISGSKNAYEAYKKVSGSVKFNKQDLFRINLTGEIEFDVERLAVDVERMLADSCYFISVKDRTGKKINISQYENDLSVKGEFVRMVYAQADISDEDKMTIINCGLRALNGKEIDL